MAYKVVAAAAIVKDKGGSQHIFYNDALLPDGLDEEHLKHLLDLGMVEDESHASKK